MTDASAKAVVVTGSAGGIGRACLQVFPGQSRVLVDVDAERLAPLAGRM